MGRLVGGKRKGRLKGGKSSGELVERPVQKREKHRNAAAA
jgi:hypothetical protein